MRAFVCLYLRVCARVFVRAFVYTRVQPTSILVTSLISKRVTPSVFVYFLYDYLPSLKFSECYLLTTPVNGITSSAASSSSSGGGGGGGGGGGCSGGGGGGGGGVRPTYGE